MLWTGSWLSYNPKLSLSDELGLSLETQLSLQIGPLKQSRPNSTLGSVQCGSLELTLEAFFFYLKNLSLISRCIKVFLQLRMIKMHASVSLSFTVSLHI